MFINSIFWVVSRCCISALNDNGKNCYYIRKSFLFHVARRTLITECLNVPQAADIMNAVQHYDPDSICNDPFAIPNRKNSIYLKNVSNNINIIMVKNKCL